MNLQISTALDVVANVADQKINRNLINFKTFQIDSMSLKAHSKHVKS